MIPGSVLHAWSLLLAVVGAIGSERVAVPVVYEAGHFYATPETRDGGRLRLIVDTGGAGGGGRYVINEAAARRLGLEIGSCGSGADFSDVVRTIDYRKGQSLPASTHPLCDAVALVSKTYGLDMGDDGVLGAGYLPSHIWTFDYPVERLWVEPPAWRPGKGSHRATLGFQRNDHGGLASGFPRIRVDVDGQPLDLLLDTGATAKPTPDGARLSGASAVHGIGVTSYVTTSVLDRWHRQHPDWRGVADGDALLDGFSARLIEVPDITVADWKLGPVWFTERPDTAYHDFMGQWMDRPIEGSLGANVFGHFVMTLDYPARTAWFACARGCRSAGDR